MKKAYFFLPLAFVFLSCIMFGQSWQTDIDKFNASLKEKDYRKALGYAQSALSDAGKEFGDESGQYATTLGNVGEAYYYLGNYEDAIDYLTQAKDLKKHIYGDESQQYALSINNLSVIYQSLGRYSDAEPLLLEALEIKKKTVGENDTSYARSLNNIGQLYQALGKYSEAEKAFLASLKIKKEKLSTGHPSNAFTFYNLGVLHKLLGNYEQAEKDLGDAIAVIEKNPGLTGVTITMAKYELAMTYIALNQEAKAKALLDNIKNEQLKDLGESHPDYAKTLYNLAMLQWSMKNYKEAEDLLVKTKNLVASRFGNVYPLYSSCLNSLGIIYWQQDDLSKAYENISQAVMIREKIFGENHPDYATSLHNLAGLMKEMGRYDEAEEKYRKAFSLYLYQIREYFPFLSENEKSRFYSNLKERFDMFNCYAITRLKENPSLISDMYDYRLATKAILLNSLRKMRASILASNNRELIDKFNKWQNVKEQISGFYSMTRQEAMRKGINLDSLESVANSLEKDLSASSAEFSGYFTGRQVKWQDVRSALKQDEAAVEIARFNFFSRRWTDTVFYAALIVKAETEDHPEIVLLKNGRELEELYIKNYRNSITHKLEDKESYNKFWSEIEAKIADKKRIYISLDGIYNKININTLKSPEGSYIVDKHDIVLLNNTSDLVTKQKPESKSGHRAALFGYPMFNMKQDGQSADVKAVSPDAGEPNEQSKLMRNIKINDLPGTKSEIDQVSSILKLKNWTADTFMEERASKSSLKNVTSPYVLHIATHGFFLTDINMPEQSKIFGIDFEKAVGNPLLRSGLLLAGAGNTIREEGGSIRQDNGVFTSYDAMNLNLEGTKLIVLSACETGLGEIKNGEGVYGLQRSFIAAGAENILMSLWNVNDQVTQELMSEFYKNWVMGETIYNAFKKAQMEIKQKYPQPYYWGAFVLVGRGE